MSVKQSPGEVNIDQFNMVTGSITLSALSSFQLFYPSRLSHLISMSFLLAVLPCILSASVTQSTCFGLMVSFTLTRIFKLLPHLTSSTSLCLSSPVILSSPNHPPASHSPLSLPPPQPVPHPPKPLRSC